MNNGRDSKYKSGQLSLILFHQQEEQIKIFQPGNDSRVHIENFYVKKNKTM